MPLITIAKLTHAKGRDAQALVIRYPIACNLTKFHTRNSTLFSQSVFMCFVGFSEPTELWVYSAVRK